MIRQILPLALFFCFVFYAGQSYTQDLTLQNAVALYQLGQYEEAKAQIAEGRSSINDAGGQYWYYYFLIHEKLLNDSSSMVEMTRALENILELGPENEYYNKLPEMILGLRNEINDEISVTIGEEKILYLHHLLGLKQFNKESTSEVLTSIGNLYIDLNQPDSSFRYFNQVSKDESEQVKIEVLLGKLKAYNALNDDDSFGQLLDSAVLAFPNNSALMLAKTDLLIEDGLFLRAKGELNSLITQQPDNPTLYIKLGEVNEMMNLMEEAITDYEKAHSLSPMSFDINFKLAVYHKARLNYASGSNDNILKVKELFENAEILEPGNVDLLREMEDFFLNIRDVENYNRVRFKLRSLEN